MRNIPTSCQAWPNLLKCGGIDLIVLYVSFLHTVFLAKVRGYKFKRVQCLHVLSITRTTIQAATPSTCPPIAPAPDIRK